MLPYNIHSLNSVIGLAEALQSELMLYGVDVHIFFPDTIFSPGLITENKTKPKITLKIEETDEGMTPERWADEMVKGTLVFYGIARPAFA